MNFYSSIGKFHESTGKYEIPDMVSVIKEDGHDNVYISVMPGLWEEHDSTDEIRKQATAAGLESIDLFLPAEMDKYLNEKSFLLKSENSDPDLKVKIKLLEMVDATIYSYMKGFWKDPSSVNSELTDSVFRAKHLLMSAVVPSFELGVWKMWHNKMKEKLLKIEDNNIAVIVNVESRYWFMDNLHS